MSREADDVNVQTSPELIPLEGQIGQFFQAINVPQTGAVRSVDGQLGPDILISTGAANKGLSVGKSSGANTITLSISGVTTAVKESGGATLDIGAVADGQYLVRSGTNVVGAAVVTPALAVATKTTNYNLADTDDVILVDCTSGPVTITLHAVATAKKKVYNIKKIDASANAMILDGNLVETIDGAANITTAVRYSNYTLFPSTEWRIL